MNSESHKLYSFIQPSILSLLFMMADCERERNSYMTSLLVVVEKRCRERSWDVWLDSLRKMTVKCVTVSQPALLHLSVA